MLISRALPLSAVLTVLLLSRTSFAEERIAAPPVRMHASWQQVDQTSADLKKLLMSADPDIRRLAMELLTRLAKEKEKQAERWTVVEGGPAGTIRLRPAGAMAKPGAPVQELIISKSPDGKWQVQEMTGVSIRLGGEGNEPGRQRMMIQVKEGGVQIVEPNKEGKPDAAAQERLKSLQTELRRRMVEVNAPKKADGEERLNKLESAMDRLFKEVQEMRRELQQKGPNKR